MGHHISAVLLKGHFDQQQATSFDFTVIQLPQEIVLFPLHDGYCDHWSEKLGIAGFKSEEPQLNSCVVHHMITTIAAEPLFAVIETDYFGGTGSQSAAVYRGSCEIMSPSSTGIARGRDSKGPINHALKMLGVLPHRGLDEFDTLGLGRFRDFDDLFERYRSP